MSITLQELSQHLDQPASQQLAAQLAANPRQNWVLFFFRRGFAPKCLLQAQDFSSHYPYFCEQNTSILGISRESPAEQLAFKKSLALPFDLISDEQDILCQQLGLLVPSSLGQQQINKLRPSTFLFDEQGRLRKHWLDNQTPGMVQQVLQFSTVLAQKQTG